MGGLLADMRRVVQLCLDGAGEGGGGKAAGAARGGAGLQKAAPRVQGLPPLTYTHTDRKAGRQARGGGGMSAHFLKEEAGWTGGCP